MSERLHLPANLSPAFPDRSVLMQENVSWKDSGFFVCRPIYISVSFRFLYPTILETPYKVVKNEAAAVYKSFCCFI